MAEVAISRNLGYRDSVVVERVLSPRSAYGLTNEKCYISKQEAGTIGGFYDLLSESMVRKALEVYTLIILQTHMAFYEKVVYTKVCVIKGEGSIDPHSERVCWFFH